MRKSPARDFHLRIRHQSGRYSSTDSGRRTRSFNLVNASIDGTLAGGMAVQAGVLNAGDTDYADEESFPEPGRTWFTRFSVNY